MTVLEWRDVWLAFAGERGEARALDGMSLAVGAGEVVALAGESGCGKSVSCLLAMGLLGPNARVRGGGVIYRAQKFGLLPRPS